MPPSKPFGELHPLSQFLAVVIVLVLALVVVAAGIRLTVWLLP